MEQLQEEQSKLQDMVNDRTRELTNQMFDDEIDKVEKNSEDQIKSLEDMWTDSKIAEMIEQSLNTGLFTDIDGNVTNLEEAMIKFAEDSGEAVGILADKVKNELSGSLKEAMEYMKDYSNITDALGFGENKQTNPGASIVNIKDFFNKLVPEDYVNGMIPELQKPEVYIKDVPNGKAPEVKVGEVTIEIKSDNGDPKAISQEIKKNIEVYFKDILHKS